jgi:hypothetical protein
MQRRKTINSAQLYKDELYAYIDSPPKGRTPLGAAKVRLRGTEARKSSWDTNRRTYALVTVVEAGNNEGGIYGKHTYCKPEQELTVPARHIIAFWDEYEAETALLRQEAKERSDRKRRGELRQQVLASAVGWKLQHEKGMPLVPILDFHYDGTGFVKFSLEEFLPWLGLSAEEIDDKVDELMEAE